MKKYTYLSTLLVFLFVFSVFIFTARVEYQRSFEHERQMLQDRLGFIQVNLESTITARMMAIDGLKAYVEMHDTLDQHDFSGFVKHIYDSEDDLVQSMAFITDTVITHVYPFETNKIIVGKDIAQVSEQREWLLYAKETLNTIITAPVDLVEGGQGIIVRVPVLKEGQYYGQVSIVFDYEKTIASSGLMDLGKNHYVQLMTEDHLKSTDYLLWHNQENPSIFETKDLVKTTVNLYDTTLLVEAYPKEGFDGKTLMYYLILSIGLVSAIIAAKGTSQIYQRNQTLRENNDYLEATINQLKASEAQMTLQFEEIKEQKAYIKHLAEHDDLTNLSNRRKFTQDIQSDMAKGLSGTILLIDIDNFKNINDTQGHPYGDRVLKYIAGVIEGMFKAPATAYRIGGDEFAIHLPGDVDIARIEKMIQRFSVQLNASVQIGYMKNHLTASIGIVSYPNDAMDVDALLMRADLAMYHAKDAGKDRFDYYETSFNEKFDRQMQIEAMIREGLESDGFHMVYQPIVYGKSTEIAYCEALVRMTHHNLSPAEFIPVAENSGLIMPLGNWIIEAVIGQMAQWRDHGLLQYPVSINISPKQIYDGDVVDTLLKTLKRHAIDPIWIEIEITESVLLDHNQHNLKVLQKLKDKGIRVALDDFGTGYASLSYLTYMPLHKVKIDKSLKDRFIHEQQGAIMKNIIAICHQLDLLVVTEGVETQEEYERLQALGSNYMQGFYFYRPMVADDVKKL